ncbi:hypothetical protein SAMD00019534_040870 [Acytostelium subglobosum LB1]|uniref:hypothetical protein n=1 Tax=Acytostelium subglobosum LB1 TaxID=1410327 RepID=UPI000644C95E|nr:hypothetical protein SAMD00019534_040870 [Acytostelium subglobosum LB1]GAM20912.1 hypothetical protein SAMD00019534_040870 [Acytostelium subglobosum LB1]|eukprot:XP_012756046.1 hypothetical protein SAMD00019534_040870 [Acytostelium subglobosum LB1]
MVGLTLVWAKEPNNNYWWPGKLTKLNSELDTGVNDKRRQDCLLIHFFGSHLIHWIKEVNIKEYSDEYMNQDLPRSLSELFRTALREAEEALIEDGVGGGGGGGRSVGGTPSGRRSIDFTYSTSASSNSNSNSNNNSNNNSRHEMMICEEDDQHSSSDHHVHNDEDYASDDFDSHILTRMKRARDDSGGGKSSTQQHQDDEHHQQQQQRQTSRYHPPHNHHSSQQQQQHQQHHQQQQHNNKLPLIAPRQSTNVHGGGDGMSIRMIHPSELEPDDHEDNDHHHSHHSQVVHHDGASEYTTSSQPMNKKHRVHGQYDALPHQREAVHQVTSAQFEDEDEEENDRSSSSENESSVQLLHHHQHHQSKPSQYHMMANDMSSTSPMLSSKRPHQPLAQQQQQQQQQQQLQQQMAKPPRSPGLSSRTKPVLLTNSPSPSTTTSTTTSANPTYVARAMASPQTRSTPAGATIVPHPMLQRSNMPSSSPVLPSKLPQSVVSALLQKKASIQANPNVPTTAQLLGAPNPPSSSGSPVIHPKTSITLSIPRFKKATNGAGSGSVLASPPMQANGMPASSQMPGMPGAASPFHLPQYPKGTSIFPQSPSLTHQRPVRPGGAIGHHPGLDNGKVILDNSHADGDQGHHVPMAMSAPMVGQSFPYMPMFPFPPFSLNNTLNMETTFSSPFNGRLAIKGSFDIGFQVEASFMGRTFSGVVTDVAQQQHQQQQQQHPQPAVPRPMTHYDMNLFETYRQWQEMMAKNPSLQTPSQSNNAQQQHGSSSSNKSATTQPSPSTKGQSNGGNHSSNSTPLQVPKTPNIVINIAKDDQAPPSIETNSSSTSVSPSHTSVADNPHFIQYKENAFQKLEQYQKMQVVNLVAKQDESLNALLEQYERAQDEAKGDADKLASLESRYIEDSRRMLLAHKEQQARLDTTHAHQSSKFLRECERQWSLKYNSKSSSPGQLDSARSGGDARSPLGSPALTPFISPSPSPSPSLSSFLSTSPMVTPASLLKGSSLAPGSVGNSLSLSHHSNGGSGVGGGGGSVSGPNTSPSSGGSGDVPPLSLSSASPPRSPNNLDKLAQSQQQHSSNNNKKSHHVDDCELNEETTNVNRSISSSNSSSKQAQLAIVESSSTDIAYK